MSYQSPNTSAPAGTFSGGCAARHARGFGFVVGIPHARGIYEREQYAFIFVRSVRSMI